MREQGGKFVGVDNLENCFPRCTEIFISAQSLETRTD